MTFVTLTYNGIEQTMDDWGIVEMSRTQSNQQGDSVTLEILMPCDGADIFPYDGQIVIQIGRVPAGGTGVNAAGLPLGGITEWAEGEIDFVGWRTKARRGGSAEDERIAYTFTGAWERWLMRTVMQKLRGSWDGAENVADWSDELTLGLSLTALTGPQDTIPGTSATNLMSVTQTIKEVVAWAKKQATLANGGVAPFQFVDLAYDESTGDYLLYATPDDRLLLPDFMPGYATAGKNSATATFGSSLAWGGDNVNIAMRAPLDTVQGLMCGECLRRTIKWIGPAGDASMWFDNTTTLAGQPTPTLNVAARDQATSVTLPWPAPDSGELEGPTGTFTATATEIIRRDDLLPFAVDLKFVITSTSNGQPYTVTIHDITARIYGSGITFSTKPGTAGDNVGTIVEGIGFAGALITAATVCTNAPAYVGGGLNSALMQALEAAAQLPDVMTTTIRMDGPQLQTQTASFATIAANFKTPSGGGTALAFWKYLFPEFADITSPDFFTGTAVTVTDDSGNAGAIQSDGTVTINGVNYGFLLTGNTAGPWMQAAGNSCQTLRVHVTGTFTGQENNNGVPTAMINHQPKHATPTLCTIQGGTFVGGKLVFGEIIPFGLSGYIYNLSQILHYDFTYTISEDEITNQVPMGSVLNLAGGRAEWATMNAQVQTISRNYVTGMTTLKCGVAEHLGVKDMVSRLQANRGIRPFNVLGANIINSPGVNSGAQLGNDVAGKSPSPGPKQCGQEIAHANLADSSAHQSAYTTGFPGITSDTRAAGQPNYGNGSGLGAPTGATLFGAAGSGGALTQWFRFSASDLSSGSTCNLTGLPNNSAVKFINLQVCVDNVQYNVYLWGALGAAV